LCLSVKEGRRPPVTFQGFLDVKKGGASVNRRGSLTMALSEGTSENQNPRGGARRGEKRLVLLRQMAKDEE